MGLANWAERQRLEFIERMLHWRGWINRRDLVRRFQLSLPQATIDLVAYTTLSSGGCAYDHRAKRYIAKESFKPQLIEPDLITDLPDVAPAVWTHDGSPLLAEPSLPARQATPEVERAVARAALARHKLSVRYWSAHSDSVQNREISPRSFGNDGLRLHVRAWCHQNQDFRDFNLSRIESTGHAQPCPVAKRRDPEWDSFCRVTIAPHPRLGGSARRAIERDYQMRESRCHWVVRQALILYALRRLGFVGFEHGKDLPLSNEVQELQLLKIEPL